MKTNTWQKNITYFITGQSISLFGSMLVQYAISWYITLETRSGFVLMLSILAGFLPSLFLSPFAGVWADRFDRKKLILIADFLIAFFTLITAILFALGYREIGLLLVVSIFRSLGSAIHAPAVNAMIPQMVPQEKLMRVSGIHSGIQSSMMIFAPILSAFLLATTNLEVLFFIDVFTAALGIASLHFLVNVPPYEKHAEATEGHFLQDIKLGLAYIRQHDFLIPFFIFSALLLFFVSPIVFLTPLQVVRTFGAEEWRLSAIEVGFALGMTAGGFLVAAWGGLKNRVRSMALAIALMGVTTILIGIVTHFGIYVSLMVITGILLPFYNTPVSVMIQEKVEADYLGRVFSVMGMIHGTMMPFGMLVFGPLSDQVELKWILVVSGIGMLAITLLLFLNKKLVAQGYKPVSTIVLTPASESAS